MCGVRGGICLRYRRGRQRAVHGERVRVNEERGGDGTGPQRKGGAGSQIQAKVDLNAQSESVRVHTHTNQLTYPHCEDFRVDTSGRRAKCLVYFTHT